MDELTNMSYTGRCGDLCKKCDRFIKSKKYGCLTCDSGLTEDELRELFSDFDLTYMGTLNHKLAIVDRINRASIIELLLFPWEDSPREHTGDYPDYE